MNNKNYFIFAAAIALASCSVDEYMGENPEFTQTTKENIIGFGGGTGSMSRTTSNTGTTEEMLDKQFKVYGWKTVKGDPSTQLVFNNYWVWYSETATPSNPDAALSASKKSWEYVGNSGTQMPFKDTDGSNKTLGNTQTIKYWDYSATDYRFVAGSPITSFTFNTGTEEGADQYAIATATVTGLGGHIDPNHTDGSTTKIDPAPVYLAKPVVIKKDYYKQPVEFKFVRLQTKVRVGIYETIPGYNITSISFYKQKEDGSSLEPETTSQNNVILTSTGKNFYGGENVTGKVTYDWDDTNNNSNPSFTYSYSTGLPTAYNWYGGKFENGIPAKSSNHSDFAELYGSDGDMSTTGYFTVIPNHNNQAIVIKCDYTLTSNDGSNETINVKGATAAIPAAYCKWEPNKMYTYIFKISQETNGTTGTPDTDDPGLFPITFDAAVIAETEAQQGTETIINAPSITTYQDGSVTANGIEYKTGTAIDITVMQDGSLKPLNISNNTVGCVKVYKLGTTDAKTEADLTVTAPIVPTDTNIDVALGQLNDSGANTKASFYPSDAGWYAIQYCITPADNSTRPATLAVYKYKVIKVENQSSGN